MYPRAEGWDMARHTATDDDEPTTTTHEATIYHRRFEDPDAEGERYEVGANLGMGYEFATEKVGIDIAEVFEDAYVKAGTVTVEVPPSRNPEAAAYSAWEDGEGHDPGSTRSMAVGDIIVIADAGDDFGFFVDSIGFEEIDVSGIDTDDEDDDELTTCYIGDEPDGDDGEPIPPEPSEDDEPTAEDIAESFGVDTDDVDEDDFPDPPERVDVSDYKTAHGAAKATYEALVEWADFYQDAGDQVVFYDPDETRAKRDMHGDVDAYTVAWEGGPAEWAAALTGGEDMHAFTGYGSFGGDPQVAGLTDGDGFGVECYYSFDLQFFNR